MQDSHNLFSTKNSQRSGETPGRPIINGIESVCSRLGQYIDYFLQPLVVQTEEFVKDTKHIIPYLGSIEEGLQSCILATADLGSLYTIIGHKEALESVK